jgi:5-methyltetrahydrofolate--homocysteine methyltransferase
MKTNTRPSLVSLLGKQFLFFDGGTGSVLQLQGLRPGELPELWNITHPDRIVDLHSSYYRAGANIIKTNTFGAFSFKFPVEDHNLLLNGAAARVITAPRSLETVVTSAVANAQKARLRVETEILSADKTDELRLSHCISEGPLPAGRPHYIAFDIGPCGHLLKPLGDLDFEDAVDLFKQTFRIGLPCGVDAVLIETMNDSYEAKAAVLAAKEVCAELAAQAEKNSDRVLYAHFTGLPVFVTTVYDSSGKLLTGADPETMTAILEGLGVSALGMNCSLGPVQMAPLIPRFSAAASVPVIVNPNAGLPRAENGHTVYDVSAEQFAVVMEQIAAAGAQLLGGCCGTDPEYICRMVNAVQNKAIVPVTGKTSSVIASYTHTVSIGGGHAPVLIGERINPTGKKRFKQALRDNDIPYIIQQGLDQEMNGAGVLDVNVGLPEIDEKQMMVAVTNELQAVTSLPLQIDTSSPAVMEAALRRYNGKALVNSVNGRQEAMNAVFPLVKKYGGVVVALTIDENGIPPTMEGRMSIVNKLYEKASRYGIDRKNIIIDPLAMAVSADSTAPAATLATIRAVYEHGGTTILGVSNVSFGLPEREFVTAAFFTMAMESGLSAAIMNPCSTEMQKAYSCFCALRGYDAQCLRYISFAEKYAVQNAASAVRQTADGIAGISSSAPQTSRVETADIPGTLRYAIIHGLRSEAASCTRNLIKTELPLDIINNSLIPALDIVGKGFEAKTMYLPQLLMSAEAAAAAFVLIREHLQNTGTAGTSRGTVILATVKGDIHDIGKNIVKVLLENYDFTVIDLGKDIAPEIIVDRCIKEHVQLVGLSALMTTTVPAMEETIRQLRKSAPWVKVCVGGAVMTHEYAAMIGADFYGKDAMAVVQYVQSVFK